MDKHRTPSTWFAIWGIHSSHKWPVNSQLSVFRKSDNSAKNCGTCPKISPNQSINQSINWTEISRLHGFAAFLLWNYHCCIDCRHLRPTNASSLAQHAEVGIFCANPRFHLPSVEWNLRLPKKCPTPEYVGLFNPAFQHTPQLPIVIYLQNTGGAIYEPRLTK